MTLKQFALLVVMALAIAGALALLWPPAAGADECTSMDAVVSEFAASGIRILVIAPPDLPDAVAAAEAATGAKFDGVTRAFVASGDGGSALGLEIAGCLLDPIWLSGGPNKRTAA